jgi:cell fate (sporulation/competence/biofilm development) regulator YlbF (YheA/YmcA/DUF963 family)
MTDVITMARDLGKALQKDERYLEMMACNAAVERNAQLQQQIAEFAGLRAQIDRELGRPEGERADVVPLNERLRKIFEEIMASPQMGAYNRAKSEMELLLSFINQIIAGSADGEDPDLIEQPGGGCGGSCFSCKGCH